MEWVQEQKRESVYEPILRDAETLGRAEYLTIRAGGDAEDGKTLFLFFCWKSSDLTWMRRTSRSFESSIDLVEAKIHACQNRHVHTQGPPMEGRSNQKTL